MTPERAEEIRNKRYHPDDVVDLRVLEIKFDLDPRTIKPIASQLGGRRIGNRWRFRWGTVMEAFSDADSSKGQRQRLVGQGDSGRQAGGLQDVPARPERRPGMEGRKRVGGNNSEGIQAERTPDPYGLRKALGVG